MTVADLLRREGMTGEFPAVRGDIPADDTPTDRIPVVDILRREGRWDRRKASRVGALAAGITALAGIAVTALTTGQMHDTAASVPGGAGGGSVPADTQTSGTPAPSVPTTEAPPIGGLSKAPEPGSATTSNGAGATQSGRSAGSSSRTTQVTPRADRQEPANTTSGSLGTSTTDAPPDTQPGNSDTTRTDPPETTSAAAQPPAESSNQQQPPSNNAGILGAVTGLLGGILGR